MAAGPQNQHQGAHLQGHCLFTGIFPGCPCSFCGTFSGAVNGVNNLDIIVRLDSGVVKGLNKWCCAS